MFNELPTGQMKLWKFKVERDEDTRRIRGAGYGTNIIGKFSPRHKGGCGAERRIVTLLKASGSKAINEIMELYLFAGVVQFKDIATMLGAPESTDYAPETPMDIIITKHEKKCTVHDHLAYLGKHVKDDKRLSLMVATVLKAVFKMLIILRDHGQCAHQDLKLDNMIILFVEDVIKIFPIDFELATLAGGTGLGLEQGNPSADIDGWGGSHLYKNTSQYFDVHTVIVFAAVYCGEGITHCSAMQCLWASFLKKTEPPARGVNSSGFCNVYLTEPPKYNPLNPTITFESAIDACTLLISGL
jgi:hypothetical protein